MHFGISESAVSRLAVEWETRLFACEESCSACWRARLASSVHLRRGLSGIRDGAGDHGTVACARAGHTLNTRGREDGAAINAQLQFRLGPENSETRLSLERRQIRLR